MDQGLLKNIKSVLKSLIISYPHGMTMTKLNHDYREIEGCPIPYEKMGFNSLENFLRSLNDTLIVYRGNTGVMVGSIPSEKTAHIERLVAKQRNTKRPRNSAPRLAVPPPAPRNVFNRLAVTPPAPTNIFNRLAVTPPAPTNIFNRLVVTPPAPTNVFNMSYIPTQVLSRSHCNNQARIQNPPDLFANPAAFQATFSNMNRRPVVNQNVCQQNVALQGNSNSLPTIQPTINNGRQYESHSSRGCESQPQKATRRRNFINNEEQLNDLANEIMQSEQRQIEMNNQKFYPIREMIPNSPASVRNYEVNDVSVNDPLNVDDVAAAFSQMKSSHIEEKLENVEEDTRSGSTDTQHSGSLLTMTGKEDLSEGSLLNVDATCTKVLNQHKTPEKTQTICDFDIEQEAIPDLSCDDIVFQLDYPDSTPVCKFGDGIPPSKIPESLENATDVFGIFVTEIHNPYRFWFHFTDEIFHLDDLMKSLEDCYTNLSQNELQMKHSCARPGQICAALFFNIWHRAEIVDKPINGSVKVFFVDYGTVCMIPLHHIKYLLREYATLPAQALRGGLAFIKPKGHRWSRNATYTLLSLVSDKFLYAKRIEVRHPEKIVSMILVDTNQDDDDIQINDAMVRKGYAKLPLDISCLSLDDDEQPVVNSRHYQEVHPTFDALESGRYPSFYEIGELLAKGIDVEAIQDSNIIPGIDSDVNDVTKGVKNYVNVSFNTSSNKNILNKTTSDSDSVDIIERKVDKISLNETKLSNVSVAESSSNETIECEEKLNNFDHQSVNGDLQKTSSVSEYEDNLCYNDLNSIKKREQKDLDDIESSYSVDPSGLDLFNPQNYSITNNFLNLSNFNYNPNLYLLNPTLGFNNNLPFSCSSLDYNHFNPMLYSSFNTLTSNPFLVPSALQSTSSRTTPIRPPPGFENYNRP